MMFLARLLFTVRWIPCRCPRWFGSMEGTHVHFWWTECPWTDGHLLCCKFFTYRKHTCICIIVCLFLTFISFLFTHYHWKQIAELFNRDVPWSDTTSDFPGDYRNGALDFGWDSFSDAQKLNKRAIELNQGRAAQMGILGLMVHESLGVSILPGNVLP